MSTNGRVVPGHARTPGDADFEGMEPKARETAEQWPPKQYGARAPGAPGSGRKRRRRQKTQRVKQRYPARVGIPAAEAVSRERVFQDLEGLLRQIREQAEESPVWATERLSEITHTVTSFTKSLEEQGDPLPERARNEYQRIREKLSQALKGE